MKKRIVCIIMAALLCALAFSFASCDKMTTSDGGTGTQAGGTQAGGNQGGTPEGPSTPGGDDEQGSADGRYTKFDLRATYDEKSATTVAFTDSGADIKGEGASADGTTVLIVGEGTYILSGSCSNGRVIVEVKDKEKVQLVLNGLKLASADNAVIWVKTGDKVSITLVDGTVSELEDKAAYTDVNADGEPNACLFSKIDLTINGTGTLNVKSAVNNGITSKDDLKIISGTISVEAKNHGIRGNDSVTIKDGNITVDCGNDGIKASKEDKEGKGYIYIEGGTISIDAGDDCLQAPISITVTGGSITTDAGGKVTNCDGTTNIADGVMK